MAVTNLANTDLVSNRAGSRKSPATSAGLSGIAGVCGFSQQANSRRGDWFHKEKPRRMTGLKVGPAFAGGAVGGERNLVVLDAGDVLNGCFRRQGSRYRRGR
jgi:hypothetical protein